MSYQGRVSLDEAVLSHALKKPSVLRELRRSGVTADHFVEDYQAVYRWLTKMQAKHGKPPSVEAARTRFPDLDIRSIRSRDLPVLVHDLQERKVWMDFLGLIDDASRQASSPSEVYAVMENMRQQMALISVANSESSIVDLFSDEAKDRMVKDLKKRKSAESKGIPTGLKRFDYVTGGLQPGRMAVVMGRPGLGKSWMDLLFTASAVMYGAKCILFPLEMSLEDTAHRLYTVFSHQMYGPSKAMKNLDLSHGYISTKKFKRYIDALQDRFEGQLLIADIGSMRDPYTIDRIDAECEIHHPDFMWVDYLTLLRGPTGRDGVDDHTTVRALSNGVKQCLVRHNMAGGCSAQVNRDALKRAQFLPRVENIAYGDAIGQDASHVISINRKNDPNYLYYAMVKNRHGPEIGKTKMKFFVDQGQIEELEVQDEEEETE